MAKVYKEEAYRVIAHYSEFDPKMFNSDCKDEDKLSCWKFAFYELWRYQMTWSMAYEIAVRESRKNGVFVDVLVKPSFKDNLVETMKGLGFTDVDSYKSSVGVVASHEAPDLVDTIVVEW